MLLPKEPLDIIKEHEFLEKKGCYSYDPKKSVSYTRSIFKTAALFFDRIYIDRFDYDNLRYRYQERMPIDAIYLNNQITAEISRYMYLGTFGKKKLNPEDEKKAFTFGVLEVAKELNLNITPLYGTIYPGENIVDGPDGDDAATIELVLSSFPLIDEENLDWIQVDEFRNDIQSIGGIRRIRSLLNQVSKCNSSVEASDLIDSRIEDYCSACAKHGVSLMASTLNQIYKKETVIAAIGTGILTGNMAIGSIIGGLKLATDMSLNLVNSIRDRRSLPGGNPEGAAALQFKKLETKIEQ